MPRSDKGSFGSAAILDSMSLQQSDPFQIVLYCFHWHNWMNSPGYDKSTCYYLVRMWIGSSLFEYIVVINANCAVQERCVTAKSKETALMKAILFWPHVLSIFVILAGVTILLSLTVFLNLVAETLPQVSDAIPLLGQPKRKQNIFIQYKYKRSLSLAFFLQSLTFLSVWFKKLFLLTFRFELPLYYYPRLHVFVLIPH